MVHVRIVGVAMHLRFVHVKVRVGLGHVPDIVRMLMVFVVNVRVRMFEIFMHVLMCVVFSDVQPHPRHHQ